MHELPFEPLSPSPAPPELRTRVLAAVDAELARRTKPRWERVLELSAAATFLVGVTWNAWQLASPPFSSGPAPATRQQLAADSSTKDVPPAGAPAHEQWPGPFDAGYAQMLIELSKQPAG